MPEDSVPNPICNVRDVPVEGGGDAPWQHHYKVLTPTMRPRGGSLGVCQNTLPPGCVTYPFHWHMREDEVFFIQSGRGVLRYGEAVYEIGPGDCISCPAGTQVAHQFANPFDVDLVFLAIGPHDPHEVCFYPDNGKLLVRAVRQIGHLAQKEYMDQEPEPPRIFELWREQAGGDSES